MGILYAACQCHPLPVLFGEKEQFSCRLLSFNDFFIITSFYFCLSVLADTLLNALTLRGCIILQFFFQHCATLTHSLFVAIRKCDVFLLSVPYCKKCCYRSVFASVETSILSRTKVDIMFSSACNQKNISILEVMRNEKF